MVEKLMVWLVHTSKTLLTFVNGHNMFGDEVYPCFFGICTVVQDLRLRILDYFQ